MTEEADQSGGEGEFRALIVDDDVDFADTLVEILEMRGVVVEVANNDGDALRAVDAFAPDVALLDVHLPGLSGFEVTSRLKQMNPELGIVILSPPIQSG